jgi:signal transduction histidine kinase
MTRARSGGNSGCCSAGTGDAEALRMMLAAAAHRGERLISSLRIAFCAAVLARFLAIEQLGALPYLTNVPAIGLAIAFSAWMLVRIRRGRAGYRALLASVAVDAIVCFLSLLQTVLWPWPRSHYAGLLRLPDMATVLVITYAAGFRLWPRLAAVGGALNVGFCLALLLIDRARWGARLGYGLEDAILFIIALVAVSALSLATATRTLGLVQSGADASVRVDRARRSLVELVRDHHDARSLLSAAAVTSDLILRSAAGDSTGGGEIARELQRRARRLKEDIEAASGFFADIGQKAYGDLESLCELQPVRLAEALPGAIERLRGRLPGLRLDLALAIDKDLVARLPGGARSLERMLYNLVANAADGDGQRGASRVWVCCAGHGPVARITVEDDGPGFGAATGARPSGKPRGMGLGLELVARTLVAAGGRLERSDRAGGGARVVLEIPVADAVAGADVHADAGVIPGAPASGGRGCKNSCSYGGQQRSIGWLARG